MRPDKYKTRQKEAIVNFLKLNNDKCKTVKDIFNYFEKKNFNIGKATIYRILYQLEEEGKIKKYYNDETKSAFFEYVKTDSCKPQTYHFKCNTCVKLIHFDCNEMKEIQEYLNKKHGFMLGLSKNLFTGKCKDCINKLK